MTVPVLSSNPPPNTTLNYNSCMILLRTSASVLILFVSTAALAQRPTTLVVATPLIEREVMAGQVSVGTVMPKRRAVIGSAVDGRVVEFPLNEGDRVEKGQLIAQLLTNTINLELKAAEAELEYRQQLLAELENGARPEELEQARARMAAAKLNRDFLESRRLRLETIRKSNQAVSIDELEEAVSLAAEAAEAYLEAKAAHELAVLGPREEQVAQARAQVAIQQAVVDQLNDRIQKYSIISRFTGYVVAEHTEVGEWVNQGDPVAEVAELDEVEVVVQVVERSVPFVQAGQRVRVEIPAFPERLFEGEIASTVPQADVRARTFPVKIRMQNEIVDGSPLFKAGMYARISLPVGAEQKAILAPKDAIVLGGPSPVVFIVNKTEESSDQGTVTSVPVQLGVSQSSLIQVAGALEPGQLVIVQGNERLRTGQTVNISRVVDSTVSLSPPPSQQ